MTYSSSSAECSICNNIWSDSKLNLCNEGENTSFIFNLYFWLSYTTAFQIMNGSVFCIVLSVQFFGILYIKGPSQMSNWKRTSLCFLLHCDICLVSSLVGEENHEAVDCLVQSHLRGSDNCFLHGALFPFLPLISLSYLL